MILADTNVFIDFWNHPTDELKAVFEREDIAICGVIRAELLHGAVSDNDFENITTMLEAFDEKNIIADDWQLLGNHLYKLRKSGLTVPFSDAIIATLAIKHDIPIWTSDKHFAMIKNVLTELVLYQP
ncbi:MAG: PIN domain-containing protein [Lachnospiraceae bacterium]|nr:PIN domain-containing protein [Lachnospiraceae bacterium]